MCVYVTIHRKISVTIFLVDEFREHFAVHEACADVSTYVANVTSTNDVVNPLPTIGNSLNKQRTLYKVLTPSIKRPYKFLWAYGSS